jgi:hypothetical protein
MPNDIEFDRSKILVLQRDLFSAVMDYQIKYGSKSISWTVNIGFPDEVQK